MVARKTSIDITICPSGPYLYVPPPNKTDLSKRANCPSEHLVILFSLILHSNTPFMDLICCRLVRRRSVI